MTYKSQIAIEAAEQLAKDGTITGDTYIKETTALISQKMVEMDADLANEDTKIDAMAAALYVMTDFLAERA